MKNKSQLESDEENPNPRNYVYTSNEFDDCDLKLGDLCGDFFECDQDRSTNNNKKKCDDSVSSYSDRSIHEVIDVTTELAGVSSGINATASNRIEHRFESRTESTSAKTPGSIRKDFDIVTGQLPPKWAMTGLHTCGDLAASLLRIAAGSKKISRKDSKLPTTDQIDGKFTTSDTDEYNVVVTASVGCCYHHITEAYENVEISLSKESSINNLKQDNDLIEGDSQREEQHISMGRHSQCITAPQREGQDPPQSGFPLSLPLIAKRYRLGRNARMIAAQPLSRTLHREVGLFTLLRSNTIFCILTVHIH